MPTVGVWNPNTQRYEQMDVEQARNMRFSDEDNARARAAYEAQQRRRPARREGAIPRQQSNRRSSPPLSQSRSSREPNAYEQVMQAQDQNVRQSPTPYAPPAPNPDAFVTADKSWDRLGASGPYGAENPAVYSGPAAAEQMGDIAMRDAVGNPTYRNAMTDFSRDSGYGTGIAQPSYVEQDFSGAAPLPAAGDTFAQFSEEMGYPTDNLYNVMRHHALPYAHAYPENGPIDERTGEPIDFGNYITD